MTTITTASVCYQLFRTCMIGARELFLLRIFPPFGRLRFLSLALDPFRPPLPPSPPPRARFRRLCKGGAVGAMGLGLVGMSAIFITGTRAIAVGIPVGLRPRRPEGDGGE